ncbi:MAG TPA: putative lipid II flippase FtsW [bacterium]|jgi:cell division protein FtsW|nr:putative lipid II flippase FtsW [bacterium]HOR57127.1 putative lipid II flippase FtsW [bacterium]HPL56081.1 putative lipid II flippase FtsW [bacterium]HPM28014.1 putative lipid II flippase FtsW [bacterium]
MNTSLDKFRRYSKRPDYVFLLVVVALVLFGLLMIYSASSLVAFQWFDGDNNYYFVGRQALSLMVGVIAMAITMATDYRVWQKYSLWMLLATIILLLIVSIPGIGEESKGASRWLDIGPIRFQPSEFAKLTLIIYFSSLFAGRSGKVNILPVIGVLAIISLFLIGLQSDLGTLVIMTGTAVATFFVAGGSYTQILFGGGVALAAFAAFIRSSQYRWERFLIFLNPSAESLDSGYHINQSLLAIGSGGLWGLGLGKSVQKYFYLPEPYTDSIFAIIAEELGFLRASLVIIAFIILAWRGIRIARNAPDNFGTILAAGIITWIILQAFVNIGALSGVLPLTGVPLPFISSGGSSLIATMAAVGILLNISKNGYEK